MTSRIKRLIATVILAILLVSLTSCGYFLYPERRGQQKGELDYPILILDGSSLLFAAVAGEAVIAVVGIVALAVDFSSGSVYLPGRSSISDVEVFPFDNTRPLAKTDLESILTEYTGSPVHVEDETIKVVKVGSLDSMHIGEILQDLDTGAAN